MNIRLAIILSGSLLISAAGGVLAALPALQSAMEATTPIERAPSPELETLRRAVLASLHAATVGVSERAQQVELLAELMAENGAPTEDQLRSASAALPVGPERPRRDPVRW